MATGDDKVASPRVDDVSMGIEGDEMVPMLVEVMTSWLVMIDNTLGYLS